MSQITLDDDAIRILKKKQEQLKAEGINADYSEVIRRYDHDAN